MLRVFLFLGVFLLAAGATGFAGDDLDGTYTDPNGAPAQPAGPDAPDAANPAAPGNDDEAPSAPRYVPLPKPDPRFHAEDSERLRHWVARLCGQASTESELTDRVRVEPDGSRTRTRATNKLGSVVLLLENYAELAEFRDGCAEKRKKNGDACTQRGRLPRPDLAAKTPGNFPWLAVGSRKFQREIAAGRSPAGVTHKTDLQKAADDELGSIQEELRKDKEFVELKNTTELTGKPGTAGAARALASSIRGASTCGVRYVSEARETDESARPGPARRPAQK